VCVTYVWIYTAKYLGHWTLIISSLEFFFRIFFWRKIKNLMQYLRSCHFVEMKSSKLINYLFIWQMLCKSDQCAMVRVFEWIHHLHSTWHSMTPRSHGRVWIHTFIVGPIPEWRFWEFADIALIYWVWGGQICHRAFGCSYQVHKIKRSVMGLGLAKEVGRNLGRGILQTVYIPWLQTDCRRPSTLISHSHTLPLCECWAVIRNEPLVVISGQCS
jgi:hypothetical protein